MTSLEQIAADTRKLPMVASANVWKEKRVYVNFHGAERSFRGDYTYKVFFCIDRGWVFEMGKGTTSRSFDADLEAFRAAVAP